MAKTKSIVSSSPFPLLIYQKLFRFDVPAWTESHDGRRRSDLLDRSNLERAVRPFETDNLKKDRHPVKDPAVTIQIVIEPRNPTQSGTFPVCHEYKSIRDFSEQIINDVSLTCDIPCVKAMPPWLKGWVDTSCVFCESGWVNSDELPLLAIFPARGPPPLARLSFGRWLALEEPCIPCCCWPWNLGGTCVIFIKTPNGTGIAERAACARSGAI